MALAMSLCCLFWTERRCWSTIAMASCTPAQCRCRLLSVFVLRELLLVVAQLAEQAFAKIAAAHAGRVELANDFEGFLQIGGGETCFVPDAGAEGSAARWLRVRLGATAAAAFPSLEPNGFSNGRLSGTRLYVAWNPRRFLSGKLLSWRKSPDDWIGSDGFDQDRRNQRRCFVTGLIDGICVGAGGSVFCASPERLRPNPEPAPR